jgi:transposase
LKSAEEIMQILEAFDLTRSFRDAGELAGCDHKTVAHWVARRDTGTITEKPAARPRLIDPFLPKLEEWMEASKGKVRADVCHDKLVAMGFTGSERTTRRVVAEVRAAFKAGRRRVHRPWVVEPGLWFQWDYGDGPTVTGTRSTLFCAWLSWSRFRVVIPIRDKTLPTVIGCVDQALRAFGGVPTYGLSDNEKTLTVDHVARVPVRNREIVTAARHYGLTLHSCQPADPASKGGSEATVRVAKADLVPTDANLLDDYPDWAALEAACAAFCDTVNGRVHRVTRRAPAEMLAEESARLHALPAHPYTTVFGQARTVGVDQPTIQWEWGVYSVPHRLAGGPVWVRRHGDDIIVTHLGADGPVEVARHEVTTPGNPRIDPAHYPPAPETPLDRTPVAGTDAERDFLAIGPGAALWLREAGETGVSRIRVKMAEAVTLAALTGAEAVDWALGHAAIHDRFAEGDLGAILAHRAGGQPASTRTAGEDHTLQTGTGSWKAFGL